jgi:hypothetical protein
MNDKEKLEKILEFVTKEEDKNYDFAGKCFDQNNMQGNAIHTLRAGAFQSVRYFIEDLEETQCKD